MKEYTKPSMEIINYDTQDAVQAGTSSVNALGQLKIKYKDVSFKEINF